MVMKNLKSGRRLAVLALFAILAMSAFGFAASNVVPDTNAGDGEGDVSGGDVTNVAYSVNANGLINSVSFNYTPTGANPVAPDILRAGLDDGTNTIWSNDCSAGPVHVCTFAAPQDIEPVVGLRVISFTN